VHDCAIIDVAHGSDSPAATITASSALLDLAVLDTHASSERFLRFRPDGRSGLGESVVNIGFPLQSLMTDAPTVTRGTLSSRAGLSGSVGQFQFSAPIQPGASGGPVIGAAGEVLAVTVGTLNAAELLTVSVLFWGGIAKRPDRGWVYSLILLAPRQSAQSGSPRVSRCSLTDEGRRANRASQSGHRRPAVVVPHLPTAGAADIEAVDRQESEHHTMTALLLIAPARQNRGSSMPIVAPWWPKAFRPKRITDKSS
jgi:hypothetical protein